MLAMKEKELNKEARRMLDLIESGTTSMTSENIALQVLAAYKPS